MANVLFKRGLQSALPATATDGAFYLTTDTNRLYVGQGEELKLLNQTVQIVNAVSSLPQFTSTSAAQAHVNDFYYCTNENILCVWKENANGTTAYGWQQINKNTDTKLSTNTFSSTASGSLVQIYDTIKDSNNDEYVGHFDIQAAGGLKVAPTTATTPGVLITGNEYSLSRSVNSNIATVTMSSTNLDTTSGFALKAGTNVHLYATGTNQIEITADDTKLSSATMTLGNNGVINIDIIDSNNDHTTASLANIGIALDNGSYVPLSSTTAGSVAGAIYSKAQIDSMLEGLDGMTYKGTVGSGGTTATLPTTGVKNGDTYVVVQSGLTSANIGGTIKAGTSFSSTVIGDMFIASGDEVDGVISGTPQWTYVPSGNDSLSGVTYAATITTANNALNVTNGDNDGVMGIKLVASTGVNVVSSVGNVTESADGKQLIATISHATYSTTSSTTANASSSSFTAITDITVDNGHVTEVKTKTFSPSTYTFSTTRAESVIAGSVVDGTRMASATNAGPNDVTFASTLYDSSNSEAVASTSIKISSETIKLSKGTNANDLVMNMEWGTF